MKVTCELPVPKRCRSELDKPGKRFRPLRVAAADHKR